jgi:hypothetical protein
MPAKAPLPFSPNDALPTSISMTFRTAMEGWQVPLL